MAPLKLASEDWQDDASPSSQIAMAAHGWFGLLKELNQRIPSDAPGFVASVTALDGRHGNIGDRFNAVQCAASGVTKSFAFERPSLRCRAIDLHPEIIFEEDEAAQKIEADIFELDGEVEVGLDRDGRRWALVAFAEDVVDETTPSPSRTHGWFLCARGSLLPPSSV